MGRNANTNGILAGILLVACAFALVLTYWRDTDGRVDTRGAENQSVVTVSHQPQQNNWRETAVHMRLRDDLDRPQDGWCLDVVGSGPHIRFDMPLIAHNIKPGLFADEAVEFTENGQIRFPAYPG